MSDLCPKCQGAMELGIVLDQAHGHVQRRQLWARGMPRIGRWLGAGLNVKTLTKVTSYRCTNCGYLESYALPEDSRE